MARGAFYANFDSKEDLFCALLEREVETRIGALEREMDRVVEPEAKLKALRDFFLTKTIDRRWCLLALEFKLSRASVNCPARPSTHLLHTRTRASRSHSGTKVLLARSVGNAEQMVKQYLSGQSTLPPGVLAPGTQPPPSPSHNPQTPNPPQPKQ